MRSQQARFAGEQLLHHALFDLAGFVELLLEVAASFSWP